jgi:glycosyltransferase involved in cell wall biosynthesis
MSGTPHILAVHQGYELYGSDRTFVSSVMALREAYPDYRVRVLLPKAGPLSRLLEGQGFAVSIAPIWVVRRADGFGRLLLGAVLFPLFVWRAWDAMRRSAICYVNTSVIFDFAVAARLARRPCIIHVHEIPAALPRRVIRAVLWWSGAALVFNSAATRAAFALPAGVEQHVLLNGVADPGAGAVPQRDDRLRILMIGRINRWKGQDLLVHAVRRLPDEIAARLDIRFAGAAFEDGPAGRDLQGLLDRAGLAAEVRLLGFVDDPAPLYEWCDIVVVPSRRPEPFGLVAIEAMAHSRAVLAAGHGGLSEIVVDGETGMLFAPGDEAALANAIERAVRQRDEVAAMGRAVRQRDEVAAMGRAGRLVYLSRFTEARYRRGLVGIVGRHIAVGRPVLGKVHAV